jgi:phosphoenolpyruvate-protein kinase (PTS system EI component)
LSLDPQFMPAVHQRIGDLTIGPCRDHAQALMAAGSIAGVRKILADF